MLVSLQPPGLSFSRFFDSVLGIGVVLELIRFKLPWCVFCRSVLGFTGKKKRFSDRLKISLRGIGFLRGVHWAKNRGSSLRAQVTLQPAPTA